LLDLETCRCGDYPNRRQEVPDCLCLDAGSVEAFDWLPRTCAYRLRAQGQPLAGWHPLVSGSSESVHEAGVSVRAWAVSELQIEDLEDLDEHIVDFDL